ncbi:hypothetical protein PIROE2DRAFT_68906 [Piromyces sp. E2]|nr:hypothetical protein PIROE2DRAFT_68906 [Piromyces sp. E2]|eukprot:OUM66814.1 hypothetical protein PIROE2DRAFT_68906 [Piromyces sp. E2]
MKFDNNYTNIISQITKELKNIQMENTIGIESEPFVKNNKINESKKCNLTERENDFVNKTGIHLSKFINKSNNNKKWENITQKKIDKNVFENPRDLHNINDTLSYPSNNYEENDNSEIKKYNPSENVIELKTFKKNIEKKDNNETNKFNTSNLDVYENIFSNNTYSENYINEDEYYSDSSSEYLSSSPFKYEDVTGIKIPSPNNRNRIFNKIASPQPESKFNIGSTIASFNEIADFIYENENKKKNLDKEEFYNSGNNNSIKKNDTFIKNYLDHTRNDHSKRKDDRHSNEKNYNNNYITFKSLSNKKINSNDVIDRGCLCSKVDPDDFYIQNISKVTYDKKISNKMDTNFYDYINVFELDNLNSNHESLIDSQSKEYILTESHDNTAEDKEEMINTKKENYYRDDNDIQNFELNKQNIYDDCIFNISS